MKRFFLSLLAVAGMLTACNMNELESVNRMGERIGFLTTTGGMTKAVDVTTANLASFEVTAFNHGTEASPYINSVTFSGGSGSFESAEPYYWPEGALDFYAWSQGAATGDQVSKTNYKTFVVTPSATPASQVDLVFAGKVNQTKAGSTDGAIAMNFRHTGSKIVVKVKNTAPNLKFVVDAWKVGYLDNSATFTYSGQGVGYDGSTDGRIEDGESDAGALAVSMWSGNDAPSASNTYTNTLASSFNVAANASAALLDGEMILIPQSTDAVTEYASSSSAALVNGSYVALKIKILNRENDAVIYSDSAGSSAWAIWPADFDWEPGKKYTYTVDLAGGGYYETNNDDNADLDPILEGAVISFASVTVDDFSQQSNVDLLVEPDPANGHVYVDLGLRRNGKKILFATMNIGASSLEESGDYFAWGETSKRYNSVNEENWIHDGPRFEQANAPFWDGSAWTKYNDTDGKTTLDASDDVAVALWGGSWHMPDKEDFEFLFNSDYCTYVFTWLPNSEEYCFKFTGKGEYAENSVYFPMTAFASYQDLPSPSSKEDGEYLTRTLSDNGNDYCYIMFFNGGGYQGVYNGYYRHYGYSVRPVLEIPE